MALVLGAVFGMVALGGVARHYHDTTEKKKEEKNQEGRRYTSTGAYGDTKDIVGLLRNPQAIASIEHTQDLMGVPCVFLVAKNGIRYRSYDLWTPRL